MRRAEPSPELHLKLSQSHYWCGRKCGQTCGLGVHTERRPRPRQHWAFAGTLSPTTRPPRRTSGGFRVVGLRVFWVWVLAGAGLVVRVLKVGWISVLVGMERRGKVNGTVGRSPGVQPEVSAFLRSAVPRHLGSAIVALHPGEQRERRRRDRPSSVGRSHGRSLALSGCASPSGRGVAAGGGVWVR